MSAVSSYIAASSYYVPAGRLKAAELEERFGADVMKRITASSGIIERRIAAPGECASDLAYRAATDLFEEHAIDRSKIDLIIFASQTPDYLLPSTACLLQDRLGLPKTCAAFDLNLGCSQYVYALSVAHSMIAAGTVNEALVLTGDTLTRIIHPQDRTLVPLFGDAGSATLLRRTDRGGFTGFVFGTDGAGANHLIWPTSGTREPKTAETALAVDDGTGAIRRRDDLYMDGAAVFLFTLKTVPTLVERLLANHSLTVKDVDLFVFHQGSELIVSSSAKYLKLPPEKIHYKLHDVGNSGGTTVPVALTDAWVKGRIKPGMRIVIAAFGVGLSWGAALIEWGDDALGPVCTVDYSDSPPAPTLQRWPLG